MVSRCRAWERGAKARLVSVAAAARYGASEALLSVIMVFCRLYAPSLHPCKYRKEGKKARTHGRHGGTQRGLKPIKVETWFRFSIPSFTPDSSYARESALSLSRYSFALSSPDSGVAVFLSLLSRPRDNDPELSKHHRWTLMEIESSPRHDTTQASAARMNVR